MQTAENPESSLKTMEEFLEATPPNRIVRISNFRKKVTRNGINVYVIKTPEIRLHCWNDHCNGVRFFRATKDGEHARAEKAKDGEFCFLQFQCANCGKSEKIYSILIISEKNETAEAQKLGEFPTYGPPTPSRLMGLVGPDRDIFLKGRRCENQGLGIGAFIYYRRVVENQKDRILTEIRKVAEKLGAKSDALAALDSAISETQFSRALEIAKSGIPESLLIDCHNPMKLLHGALSEGVHAKSDEECLEIASSVRVVLAELSERLGQALKDEAELHHAVAVLLKN